MPRLHADQFDRCLAQSTGVLVINNYQVILYNGLGLFGYLPLLLYAVYATWAAVLNLTGASIVDRVGRVKMLAIGVVCSHFRIVNERDRTDASVDWMCSFNGCRDCNGGHIFRN